MIPPRAPPHEAQRLTVLDELRILDTDPEPTYDDLVSLAARVCEAPIGLISLVDADRQWFKARCGLDATETPRSISFCGHAVLHADEPLVVPDARLDERFFDNPLVTGDPNIRLYVGVPLRGVDGHPLGTLCVIDRVARALSPEQLASLKGLARIAEDLLRLRRAARRQDMVTTAMHETQLALEKARLEADAMARVSGELVCNVSHELRTPLQVILGFAELGKARQPERAKAAQMFAQIETAGIQMLGFVNDLLDLSKLNHGAMRLRLEPADLCATLSEVCGELSVMAALRDVQLPGFGLSSHLRICIDVLRFKQVVRNVVVNAIRHSPVSGQIRFHCLRDAQEGVVVVIADQGPGIPEPELQTIFDPFVQATTTASKSGSTGLGLSIARAIMRAHGGDIRARNGAEGGAEFVLTLPADAVIAEPA